MIHEVWFASRESRDVLVCECLSDNVRSVAFSPTSFLFVFYPHTVVEWYVLVIPCGWSSPELAVNDLAGSRFLNVSKECG